SPPPSRAPTLPASEAATIEDDVDDVPPPPAPSPPPSRAPTPPASEAAAPTANNHPDYLRFYHNTSLLLPTIREDEVACFHGRPPPPPPPPPAPSSHHHSSFYHNTGTLLLTIPED